MEIIEQFKDDTMPNDCNCCGDEWNGINFVKLKLFNNFILQIGLCNECMEILKNKGGFKVT